MLKNKVIIEVRGGLVQNVFSNIPLEYVVVDYDSDAGTWVSEKQTPEEITGDLPGLYSDLDVLRQLGDF